jgi:hypothetical protein
MLSTLVGEQVRELIGALADAYVQAFTHFRVPAEPWAEQALKLSAEEIAAGAIAGLISEIELHATRTSQPELGQSEGHVRREITHAMENTQKTLEELFEANVWRWRGKSATNHQPQESESKSPGSFDDATVAKTRLSAANGSPEGSHVMDSQKKAIQHGQPRAADVPSLESGPQSNPDKGNLQILRGTDGKLKEVVTLTIASRFGGVSMRAIQKAAGKSALECRGNRTNRRVVVSSLLKYFPPEHSAN